MALNYRKLIHSKVILFKRVIPGTPPKKNQEGKSVTERSFSSFFQGGVPRRMSGEVVV